MAEYTVKFGMHVGRAGEIYNVGDVIESESDLNKVFLNKFEPSVGLDHPPGPMPPVQVKPPQKKADKDKADREKADREKKTHPVAARFKEEDKGKE